VGYRSEVVLAVTKQAAPYFMAMLAKSPDTKRMCEAADEFEGDFDDEGGWLVRWDSIKWYEGHPEVDEVNDFIEAMSSDDLTEYGERESSSIEWSEHFIFVRVGEECDDIRREGFGPWQIYPQTSIHIGSST
jgi:hypothetical protein